MKILIILFSLFLFFLFLIPSEIEAADCTAALASDKHYGLLGTKFSITITISNCTNPDNLLIDIKHYVNGVSTSRGFDWDLPDQNGQSLIEFTPNAPGSWDAFVYEDLRHVSPPAAGEIPFTISIQDPNDSSTLTLIPLDSSPGRLDVNVSGKIHLDYPGHIKLVTQHYDRTLSQAGGIEYSNDLPDINANYNENLTFNKEGDYAISVFMGDQYGVYLTDPSFGIFTVPANTPPPPPAAPPPAAPPAGGLPDFGGDPAGLVQVQQLVLRAINLVVPIAFFIVTIVLVWGGIKYLTSAGEAKPIQAASNAITWAILGILFLALAWLILKLVEVLTGVPFLSQFCLGFQC